MPLFIKDLEVDSMAERLAALTHVTKTEAVKRALRHELERQADRPTLVDRGLDFTRELRARAGNNPAAADKPFIDSLYDNADVR
jgi:antitoxin VapB